MIDAIKNVASLSMTRGLGSISTDTSSSQSSGLSTPGMGSATSTGQSFASVMSNMATSMADSVKQAESASFAGMNGTMDTRKVVDAVMQANQSLQTAIAFRDKLLSAYQDITKMQI